MCASSAAMAMAFDAGGRQRQKDIWVGDLTDDEAERLLALHGHKEDWLQFTEECPLAALLLVVRGFMHFWCLDALEVACGRWTW